LPASGKAGRALLLLPVLPHGEANRMSPTAREILSALAFSLIVFSLASPPCTRAGSGSDAPGGPTIIYTKVFKGSTPEYVEIRLGTDGHGTADVRQADESADPQPFAVSAALAQKIFSLVADLHNFQGVDLDVHRKIAYLGQKTLRYENGSQANEVRFNYTTDPTGSKLVQIFEGLGRQQEDLSDLERMMRYDKLGVNDALNNIQADVENKVLPEPESLLGPLDKLASDERYLEIARTKARTLAERIRGGHPLGQ
jgi:hypothetical protein